MDESKIIVDEFQDKPLDQLVQGDYYLFCVVNEVLYFYKDYQVFKLDVASGDDTVTSFKYTEGTLSELRDKLERSYKVNNTQNTWVIKT